MKLTHCLFCQIKLKEIPIPLSDHVATFLCPNQLNCQPYNVGYTYDEYFKIRAAYFNIKNDQYTYHITYKKVTSPTTLIIYRDTNPDYLSNKPIIGMKCEGDIPIITPHNFYSKLTTLLNYS